MLFGKSFLNPMSFFKFSIMPEGEGGGSGGGGGAGDGGEGGGAGDGGEGDKGGKGGKNDTVSRADHERVTADMKKYKARAKELEDADSKRKDEELKRENKWKEIAENKEKEAKEAKDEATRIKSSYVDDRKFSEVKAAAMALGLRAEAVEDLESLDLADVETETTSKGKINVLGADKFAERLKASKPHWFAEKSGDPNVNTGGTRVRDSKGQITVEQIMKAEAEARKTGDRAPYEALVKKYNVQRAAARRAS